MSEIKFEIVKQIAVLSKSNSGWQKELNLVSWNDREAKYDIRDWSPNHDKMSKGVTLTEDEFNKLKEYFIENFGAASTEVETKESTFESPLKEEKPVSIEEEVDEDVFIEDNYDKDPEEPKDEDVKAIDEFDEAEDIFSGQDDIFEGVSLDDPVRMYLKEIGQYSLLHIDREKRLAREKQEARVLLRSKKLDEQLPIDPARMIKLTEDELKIVKRGELAQEVLIKCNLRLVVSIAKRYIGHGLSLLDLIQEGNIGLVRGIEKFDYTMGYKLSTYVTWWIRQAVTRALSDQSKTIRIPVHMVETINRLNKEKKRLTAELGHEPSIKQLAKSMNMSKKKVEEVMQAAKESVSLDELISGGCRYDDVRIKEYDESVDNLEEKLGRVPTILEIADEMGISESEVKILMDLIDRDNSILVDFVDPNALSPETNAERVILKEEIQGLLAGLKERERKVLILRFGIDDDHPRTLEEIGKELKVTRERIRQIEEKALRKLKIRARNLQDIIK